MLRCSRQFSRVRNDIRGPSRVVSCYNYAFRGTYSQNFFIGPSTLSVKHSGRPNNKNIRKDILRGGIFPATLNAGLLGTSSTHLFVPVVSQENFGLGAHKKKILAREKRKFSSKEENVSDCEEKSCPTSPSNSISSTGASSSQVVSQRSRLLMIDEDNRPYYVTGEPEADFDDKNFQLKLQMQPDCDELIASRTGLDLHELKRALKLEYMSAQTVKTHSGGSSGIGRSCPDGEFEGRVLEFVEKYCKHLSDDDLELVMDCSSRMRLLRNSPEEQEAFLKDLEYESE